MVWLVVLTPPALLALILGLAAVERRLFGDQLDLRLTGLRQPVAAHLAVHLGEQSREPARDVSAGAHAPSSRHPAARSNVRRGGAALFRFHPGRHALSRSRAAADPAATPQPAVHPKAEVENLLPDTVFTTVSGECARCGGDLSRGFMVARDAAGENEQGLVCPCCDWLDDAEREATRRY